MLRSFQIAKIWWVDSVDPIFHEQASYKVGRYIELVQWVDKPGNQSTTGHTTL
jgi:hypothetical protein